MAEWLKAHAWKACLGETLTWVRIPLSPPVSLQLRELFHTVSSTIENGFVHLPENAEWLSEYLHELTTFPKGKHDDQADSTSKALDWVRQGYWGPGMGIFYYYRMENEKLKKERGLRS